MLKVCIYLVRFVVRNNSCLSGNLVCSSAHRFFHSCFHYLHRRCYRSSPMLFAFLFRLLLFVRERCGCSNLSGVNQARLLSITMLVLLCILNSDLEYEIGLSSSNMALAVGSSGGWPPSEGVAVDNARFTYRINHSHEFFLHCSSLLL